MFYALKTKRTPPIRVGGENDDDAVRTIWFSLAKIIPEVLCLSSKIMVLPFKNLVITGIYERIIFVSRY